MVDRRGNVVYNQFMTTTMIGIRVDPSFKEHLSHLAKVRHQTLADVVRGLVYEGMVAAARATGEASNPSGALAGTPDGQRMLMDNSHRSSRRTLPVELAAKLQHAHQQSGASYRVNAHLAGIDVAHLHRITTGSRCPSVRVANRLIEVLALDDQTAAELLEVAVPRSN